MIEIKNNTVLRDGEEIGVIDGSICTLLTNIGPAIKGQIRKAAENEALSFMTGDMGSASEPVNPDEPVFEDGRNRVGIERLMHAVKFEQIPPPPDTHSQMGDKDPAFVGWFKAHSTPEEFAHKYGNRKLPSYEEYEKEARALADPWRKLRSSDGVSKEIKDDEA